MRNGDVTPGLRVQHPKGGMPMEDGWAPGHSAQHWAMVAAREMSAEVMQG